MQKSSEKSFSWAGKIYKLPTSNGITVQSPARPVTFIMSTASNILQVFRSVIKSGHTLFAVSLMLMANQSDAAPSSALMWFSLFSHWIAVLAGIIDPACMSLLRMKS